MKWIFAIALLLTTTLSYAQKATLLQNINVRAQELKHKLNTKGDSIILNGERTIEKVEIFNSNFEREFIVNAKNALIPLENMPAGRFVTEVKLKDKRIIITLIVHEDADRIQSKTVSPLNKVTLDTEATLTKDTNQNASIIINSNGKLKEKSEKNVKFYWIVKNINKGHSSSRVMRIGDIEVVEKMILQNQIDLRTKAGKRNDLTIWEVYDTSAFMRFKRLNPDYANISEADCFNVMPYYKSLSDKNVM